MYLLRIQLKLNTALLSTVRPCVTGVTPHISHIYKGINAMLIIRGPIKPYIFWIKIILAIFLAKTRADKTNFSALTNLTIDFDAESALFILSCCLCILYHFFLSLETIFVSSVSLCCIYRDYICILLSFFCNYRN